MVGAAITHDPLRTAIGTARLVCPSSSPRPQGMSILDEAATIVLDIGSSSCKSGFAGDEGPQSVIPSLLGESKVIKEDGRRDTYIGYDATNPKDIALRYLLQNGIVNDWNDIGDDMEMVLDYIFTEELRQLPSGHPILMTESPLNPKANREYMTQLMFEKFEAPYFYMALQSILSQYSSGRVSGLMVDIGHGSTHILPIYEGHALLPAVKRWDFAGHELTNYLQSLLQEKGYCFSTLRELELVRDIKENLCNVSLDFQSDIKFNTTEKKYTLPDGNILRVSNESFRCPEVLFQPQLLGINRVGVHKMIYESIMASDIDTRPDLFVNIILSGGSSLFEGMDDRLMLELGKLIPQSKRFNVVALPERKYHVWIGGSILGSLSTFTQMWISKDEYDEYGPNILHRRCIL